MRGHGLESCCWGLEPEAGSFEYSSKSSGCRKLVQMEESSVLTKEILEVLQVGKPCAYFQMNNA
jgi:hypothetical protein